MKRKEKVITILGLSVLVCSLFLVTIPVTAIAAEQDNYVLGVYGNANEDDNIDMRDLTYVKLIFFGKKPETELADAKYDGKINPLDFIQIKLIIVGKEKEITIVDGKDRIVTINKPIKHIIPISSYVTEVMRSLKATDTIVGVPSPVASRKAFFQELAELPNVGGGYGGSYDYEKIVELRPDLFILYATTYDEVADKIESIVPGVTVVRLSCPYMGCESGIYYDYVRKLGYILDRMDEAEELIGFYEECLSQIKEKVDARSEDEKPRVFYTLPSYFPRYSTVNRLNVIHEAIVEAGGINIAADIGTETSSSPNVDPEWVIEQNPDIIIGGTSVIGYTVDKPPEADMKAMRDMIMNHPGWGGITAVESDRVYLLGQRLFSSTHYSVGPAYMAKLFHPDLFEDFDPQTIHQEYLDRFHHIDFDVKKQGVFVYPPLKD